MASASRYRLVKLDEYAARGIPQYWLVDPQARTLEVFTATVAAGGAPLYARAAAAAAGLLTVPGHEGLSIDLDELFAGLDD